MKSTINHFDLASGLSTKRPALRRQLSQMRGMFYDAPAYAQALASDDALVYEFYDLGIPADPNEVAFGTSITYPGKVGDEYFMTKGHFHTALETAEAYFCLRGHGFVLMENPEGDWEAQELTPGVVVNIPGRYAHRSINVSASEPFVFYFAVPGHAGHDYGTIETQGFRKLLVDRGGVPTFIDNPRWSSRS